MLLPRLYAQHWFFSCDGEGENNWSWLTRQRNWHPEVVSPTTAADLGDIVTQRLSKFNTLLIGSQVNRITNIIVDI